MKLQPSMKNLVWSMAALLLIALAAVAYTNQRRETAENHGAAPGHTEAGADKPLEKGVAKDAHGHATNTENGHAGEAGPAGEEGLGAGDGHNQGGEEGHVDEVTLTPEAIRKNGIKVDAARKQFLSETFTVPARVSYNNELMAHIGTPVEGRISEIKVRLGDLVKKGDTLLMIDSPTLGEAQSAYLQKRTQAQVAESAMEVSQTAAARAKRLLEGKGLSLSEYQRREGEHKAAKGALRAAEAATTAAENHLRLWGMSQAEVARLVKTGEINPRYVVRAPIAGTVVRREVTMGEIVGPDREALLVLADMKSLWVLADAPENTIHRIVTGSPARVSVEGLKDQTFNGKVTYIAPELDKSTRTGQVRVEIEDGLTPLKAGMFAQVHLSLGGKEQTAAIAVPETAVQTVEGGPVVFVEVPGEPGAFAKQAVVIGPAIGSLVPVLSGLEEGKRYVVAGAFILKAELAKGIMEGKTCSGH